MQIRNLKLKRKNNSRKKKLRPPWPKRSKKRTPL